jgi:hypothetical protein
LNLILNSWNGIVSLFIACIEILLLVNLLIFSEKNRINILIYFLVALLAVYQTLEFFICSLGFDSSFTAYLAFADISFLPPLSLILTLYIFRWESKLNYLLFIPAVFFTAYYLIIVEQFAVVQCTVLYATYNYPMGDIYGFFYYLPILISFLIILRKKNEIDKKQFLLLFTAHLFIMLPVVIGFILLYLNIPGLIKSMESILCKFAFGYAVALSIFCLSNKMEQ